MKVKVGAVVLGILVVATIAGLGYRSLRPGSTAAVSNNNKSNQQSTDSPPNFADSSKWVSVFSDDFNGNKLDNSKWSTCYDWREPTTNGCTNSGNNEQEWYLPSQISVSNGSAILAATNKPVTVDTPQGVQSFPYRSGMISTGRQDANSRVKWSATYGYYIARMKIDGGQGVWPAFWLLPADRSWPPEIDIMEFLGNKSNQVLLTNHWQTPGGPQKDGTTVTGPDYTNGWHTYAVNWQPGIIEWYVDGALKKTITGSTVPNKPMEMIFDLAIGGQLPGNTDSNTPFPRMAQIDYVKVYEKKL